MLGDAYKENQVKDREIAIQVKRDVLFTEIQPKYDLHKMYTKKYLTNEKWPSTNHLRFDQGFKTNDRDLISSG